ncbi:MAG: hypothetical protein ACE1ZC_00090 [Nitrososphaerales archaeon]
MNDSEKLNRLLKEIVTSSEALFGPLEEMSIEEVEGQLNAAGISPAELTGRFHQKVKDIIRKKRAAGEPIPSRYRHAREQSRPLSEPPEDPESVRMFAKRVVDNARRAISGIDQLELEFSFRRDSALTKKDEAILKRLESELRDRARKRRGDE